MPVNLSVKKVPDHIARQLRLRAKNHHRSLQGELVAILEEAVAGKTSITAAELLDAVRSMGLATPGEAASIVRKDRDAR